ncbi:MAG TPA: 3'-5' exonuclease [Nitrospirae bacterium]|nr:putative 3'-5' exonuclease related to the exonuclease domain of PolB [bacterium BMS3Abin10]GBE38930.1 putative 3'-5' exonuclease related to the exonuclease domain of PolB [bacterium BMS3Bbin08]HDK16679.1 3'-5' exonuclease [Nitrospirota bacterium]HDK82478.1 3'-5' exonuclease [Nitrospirota bacterium]
MSGQRFASKKIVVDIETIGRDFESFDEISREYLLKFAETEEQIKEVKDGLGFSPLTGEIVAIGMLNPDTNKGAVYFQAPGSLVEEFEENDIRFVPDTEEGILKSFWEAVKHYDQVITFNGRGFDAPYLLIRSAVHKIKPTRDLMPNRFNSTTHADLFDQLTFYGSVRRKFSLHMWCKAFGIKSPKEEGITGLMVNDLFKERKYADIARYCVGDLYATAELFNYWNRYVKFPQGK